MVQYNIESFCTRRDPGKFIESPFKNNTMGNNNIKLNNTNIKKNPKLFLPFLGFGQLVYPFLFN